MREPGDIRRGDTVRAHTLHTMKEVMGGNFVGKLEGKVLRLGKETDDPRIAVLEYGAPGDRKMQIPILHGALVAKFDVIEEGEIDE